MICQDAYLKLYMFFSSFGAGEVTVNPVDSYKFEVFFKLDSGPVLYFVIFYDDDIDHFDIFDSLIFFKYNSYAVTVEYYSDMHLTTELLHFLLDNLDHVVILVRDLIDTTLGSQPADSMVSHVDLLPSLEDFLGSAVVVMPYRRVSVPRFERRTTFVYTNPSTGTEVPVCVVRDHIYECSLFQSVQAAEFFDSLPDLASLTR